MAKELDALHLIQKIYSAATYEAGWAEALEEFGRFFDAVGAVMHANKDDFALLHVSGSLLEGAAAYNTHWYQQDPMISRVRDQGIRSGLIIDQRIVPKDLIKRGAFHQEFLAPLDIGSISTILTNPAPGASVLFSLQNPLGRDPVSEADPVFMAVSRHFAKAAGVATTIRTLRAERDALMSSFGRFQCAAALVGANGAVLASNMKLQTARDGVVLKRGRLFTSSPGQQRRLDAFIRDSLQLDLGTIVPDSVPIYREGHSAPLLLKSVPVAASDLERRFDIPRIDCILLIIIDPVERSNATDLTLIRALGLTPAQSKIALLLGTGHAPNDIAILLGIKTNTVRTTIKNIYAKLNISRQAELVRIINLVGS